MNTELRAIANRAIRRYSDEIGPLDGLDEDKLADLTRDEKTRHPVNRAARRAAGHRGNRWHRTRGPWRLDALRRDAQRREAIAADPERKARQDAHDERVRLRQRDRAQGRRMQLVADNECAARAAERVAKRNEELAQRRAVKRAENAARREARKAAS